MNKSCVLLINFHQLLICFVSHCGLWICSHGNQIGHTLRKRTINAIYQKVKTLRGI